MINAAIYKCRSNSNVFVIFLNNIMHRMQSLKQNDPQGKAVMDYFLYGLLSLSFLFQISTTFKFHNSSFILRSDSIFVADIIQRLYPNIYKIV